MFRDIWLTPTLDDWVVLFVNYVANFYNYINKNCNVGS